MTIPLLPIWTPNGDIDGDLGIKDNNQMKRQHFNDEGGANNYLVARGDRAGEKDGDMAAWAGGPV